MDNVSDGIKLLFVLLYTAPIVLLGVGVYVLAHSHLFPRRMDSHSD